MEQMILEGKNCLVTGASGGIGIEIVKELAKHNCNLFLTSKSSEKLEKLVEELSKIHSFSKFDFFAADLSQLSHINNLISKIRNSMTHIDILINCAGVFPINYLKDSSVEEFENCFNVNVKSPFLLSKEFSKDMIEKNWGRIVNIGSSSSYEGFKRTSVYCSSKHALLGLSRSLFDELKEFNVRTFCISPGSVKTDMAQVLTNQDFSTFIDPKEIAQMIISVMSFDNEMISEEIRLNRLIKK